MSLSNKILKIGLALVSVVFWLWIFLQNIVPSGKFATSTDFTGVNPWLPGLRPIERVLNRKIIVSDPIYLDIKLPTHFDELRLRLDYDNQSGGDFRVGIFTNKDKWQILFSELKNGEASFDLRSLPLEKNIVPVVLGTPKATVDKPVIISKIEVTVSRPKLTTQQFKELARKPKVLLFAIISLIIVSGVLFFIFLPITASTFAAIISVGSFLDAMILELWRPGFVANFMDTRIFILLFLVIVGWYWMAHRKKN